MALFFQGNKAAVEWDPKNNTAKFQFVRKYLTTEDPKLIQLLIDMSYERVDEDDLVESTHTKSGNVKGPSTASPLLTRAKKNPLRVRRKNPSKTE